MSSSLSDLLTSKCHKCGHDVEPQNNATYLDYLMTGNPMLGLALARHLLPLVKDDQVICEGSPSRAQYLEGQPRDTRPAYAYREEFAAPHREAYARLQALATTVETVLTEN